MDTSLLASVAAAAAATPATPETAPASPSAEVETSITAPRVSATSEAGGNGSPTEAAASVAANGLTARTALELTALAYPTMSAALAKLAIAADGGETAFRAALLADRATDGSASVVSTAQTDTAVADPAKAGREGRGAGLKAAAAALNSK